MGGRAGRQRHAITPVLVGTARAWHEAGGSPLSPRRPVRGGADPDRHELYNDVGDYERGADGADRLGPPRASSMGRVPRESDAPRRTASDWRWSWARTSSRSAGGRFVMAGVGRGGHRVHGGPRPTPTASGEFFVFVFFGLVATVGSCFP
jgi:1,4-dihydroxy-2-naphthoate octaprenyltransferase